MRRNQQCGAPTLMSAAIHGCSLVLAHAPDLVRHGSKPTRENAAEALAPALRTFDEALAYPPHQVFIGNLSPDALWAIERPWWRHSCEPKREGPFGVFVDDAGGSLAKLGMKFAGALRNDVPVLEDVLAGLAILVGPAGDGAPVVRLDAVGRHRVGSGSAQQAVLEDLVVEPLSRLGRGILDVDRYATELHDPDITEPAGAGNVPSRNYRLIGALAVKRGELPRERLDGFEHERGLP